MFEGTKLLDYGVCSCEPGINGTGAVAVKRIDSIIRLLHPMVIVVRQQSRPHERSRPDSQSLLKSLHRTARTHGIDVDRMLENEVKAAFAPFHAKTKYEVASVVARLFPELLPKLPPPRKAWQPEREIMAMFDAVAVGLIDIEHRRDQILPFL
jgi:hypothetical protein